MEQANRPPGGQAGERRTTPRFGVEFWVEEHDAAGVYFHRVTNISRDGFFVEKKLPFQVGQTLQMRLDLPGSERKYSARTRVVDNYHDGRSNLRGAGFQFVDLDSKTRAGIEAVIEKAGSQGST
ncbi:MAG: PilZ domain-containing protein [Desulfobacterales bacterium]|jgi:Tfp pilus assembly protein PilZ